MNVIVTYDIKRNHTEIKTELIALGYQETIRGERLSDKTPINNQLPNTTLIRYGATSTKSCCDQVISVISKHNGGLDSIFCAELSVNFSWTGQ